MHYILLGGIVSKLACFPVNQEQLAILEPAFEECDTPTFEMRERLSAQTGMTNREVQVITDPFFRLSLLIYDF